MSRALMQREAIYLCYVHSSYTYSFRSHVVAMPLANRHGHFTWLRVYISILARIVKQHSPPPHSRNSHLVLNLLLRWSGVWIPETRTPTLSICKYLVQCATLFYFCLRFKNKICKFSTCTHISLIYFYNTNLLVSTQYV